MSKFYTNVSCIGNKIYYRGIENGRRIRQEIEYAPTLYLRTEAESPFKTLQGEPLEPRSFHSIRDARDFIKKYEGVQGFKIYGNDEFEYAYIAEQHPEELIEWKQDDIRIAYIDIEVGSEKGFPKVEDAKDPIVAITIKFSHLNFYYVLGCGDYTPPDESIRYLKAKDEHDLIMTFMTIWNAEDPDVVTGWNIKTFDIPYLYNRIRNLQGEKLANWLSPLGKVYERKEFYYGKDILAYELMGISILDYLQLFRKYAPNAAQESYKLDHIAWVELKERKLSYDEYDSLHHLFKEDYQKFIDYNIKDVKLVERLEAKGRLITMALTLAYDNKTNYDDVFMQVRMWDCICYNYLLRKNIIVPPKEHKSKESAYEGAYVKDPQIGFFRWVASFDLNSLYPHLIMMYNLSPEMTVEPGFYSPAMCKIHDYYWSTQKSVVEKMLTREIDLSALDGEGYTFTPNGQFFRTRYQGFLPEIMQKMYDDRVVYKKKMLEAEKVKESEKNPEKRKEWDAVISRYKNLQLAKKVGLNSAYGAMGNEYFRFFDTRIAEAVTLAGQLSIRWIENALNQYLNNILQTKNVDYVIASDTDSVYLNLSPLIDKIFKDQSDKNKIITAMDKICREKLTPFIDQQYQDLATYVHAYAQKMQMKRESLADSAIWTAKKRYILNVYDSEGVRYAEPKLKIQGLEAIKSSTPTACRDKIKESIKIIIRGDEKALHEYIEAFRQEFKTLPAEDIAFPRSVNGLKSYQPKKSMTLDGFEADDSKMESGTPIHAKGSLLYNYYIKKMGLESQYPLIQEGEKIKFIYLREPNRFRSPVIAFPTRAPKEFKLSEIIDYEIQFNKSFLEPIKIILTAIGWDTEQETTLESFFS